MWLTRYSIPWFLIGEVTAQQWLHAGSSMSVCGKKSEVITCKQLKWSVHCSHWLYFTLIPILVNSTVASFPIPTNSFSQRTASFTSTNAHLGILEAHRSASKILGACLHGLKTSLCRPSVANTSTNGYNYSAINKAWISSPGVNAQIEEEHKP